MEQKLYTVMVYRRHLIGAFTSLQAFEEIENRYAKWEYDIDYHSGKTAEQIMMDEGLDDFDLIAHD